MPPRGPLVIGIDLGTTNTVVAWADKAGREAPRVFDVPQLVTPTETEARSLLPSCLYASLEGELRADAWDELPWCVGEIARRRGVLVPSRFVASSKSWLGHARVDRMAPILPWGLADDAVDAPRLSPVDAGARVLIHVRRAWDAERPSEPLAEQDVVLTVPASFDDAARELTLECAARAGIPVRLLEEPQAAFYDYLHRQDPARVGELADRAGGQALVLVCDVGGGTTDLSLLRVTRTEGKRPFEVERIAVGHHLLLGGDNMDLALAHALEPVLSPGSQLDAARFSALVLACRAAKERLLGEAPPDAVPIRLLARGSSLIGSTLAAELTRAEAERIVIEGFFPDASRDALPSRVRGGLVAFGLPYEKDSAVTRHVANFFGRHAGGARGPDAVLFNGGVFLADRIAARVVDVLASWCGPPIDVLPHDAPDVAVARGAVRYGLARLGIGPRIEAGAARGYYVGLTAQPGAARPLVCVVPRGAKEGVAHAAEGRTFALRVGRPVRFDLFASDEANDVPGAVALLDVETFEALPPAFVSFDGAGSASEIEVGLEGELSPTGTLDLACVARGDSARRFRLAFDLRKDPEARPLLSSMPPSSGPSSLSVRALAAEGRAAETVKLAAARESIEHVFGKGRPDVVERKVKDLVRDLEKTLGERAAWSTETARALADVLVSNARARKRSPDHERVFWMLAGFTLRPGFGDPNDGARIAELAPLFDEKLAFPNEARGYQQFWIAWRRVAGGLDEARQTQMRDVVDPLLAPSERRLKKPKGWKAEAASDLLDFSSCLERVLPTRRSELAGWILERTWTDRDPRLWLAIGRLGAREPAYASAHHVVSPIVAERFLDHLLREKWDGVRDLQWAAAQLARLTADRSRDVGEAMRGDVARRLRACGAPDAFARVVEEHVAVVDADTSAFFGESLPVGLRLVS